MHVWKLWPFDSQADFARNVSTGRICRMNPRYEFIGKKISYTPLPRKGWFGKQYVWLDTPFTYWYQGTRPITVPASKYDGFTVPLTVQLLSLNRLHQWMAGIEASMVHDVLCKDEKGNRKFRRLVFAEAYDVATTNAGLTDKWSSTIKRGVIFGSKYLGRC